MFKNWYSYFLCIITFLIIGFLTFNNTTSAIIFGIVSGGIFGWVLSSPSKKSNKS
ncbi:hypothetical protein [Alkalihalobacillus trypoxylicola]|uniref:hypothetical protein n=1 Tax=Alkalihalobacillus trypoxylicola TaxID=519424 RepID=UPI000AF6584F|nr:hypothetical protein [Alkalihalobacillus trypoxylicola]